MTIKNNEFKMLIKNTLLDKFSDWIIIIDAATCKLRYNVTTFILQIPVLKNMTSLHV